MPATIKDVAKLAGVSFKTVSRVINREPSVGKELQEKVWAAAKELSYQPNKSARLLRGTPSSIAFIYDNPNSHYVIELQNGILAECNEQGFDLVIHPCDSKSPGIIEEIATTVKRAQVAGLVLTPPLSERPEVIERLREQGVKFVRILSAQEADNASPCVFIDDRMAAANITRHLIELGHKRIAFLGGDTAHKSSIERLEGYKQALRENELEINEALILDGDYSFESGVERTKHLLEENSQQATAVFACNDEIAAGTLFAARLLGTEIPAQLSIVGFEDSPFSRQTWPKLTTAQQPNGVIAQTAAALLIQEIRDSKKPVTTEPAEPSHQGFYPELVIRDSTAQAPA